MRGSLDHGLRAVACTGSTVPWSAARCLSLTALRAPTDPGFREVVHRVKDLLVGREVLVELRQSDQGQMIGRRAMELGVGVVE